MILDIKCADKNNFYNHYHKSLDFESIIITVKFCLGPSPPGKDCIRNDFKNSKFSCFLFEHGIGP